MMKFIKTVRTTNGNYAVFFQQEYTGYMAGVYLNRDGHLIRPMSHNETEYCWKNWAADAKSVVPKFHVPFLTIGRELQRFYWDFPGNGDDFSTVSEAQKWVEERFDLVSTERYESIPFMGKTITAYAVWYDETENSEKSFVNGRMVTGSHYFNVIS